MLLYVGLETVWVALMLGVNGRVQIMEFNESPLFMLLDPVSEGLSTKKKLPVTLFESELHVLNGAPTMLFVKAPFKIETSETEGISVDHISKIAPIGDSSKSSRTENRMHARLRA